MPSCFLRLPTLPDKPRATAITHVIDPGLGLRDTLAKVESRGEFIDMWKFGWGTAYVEPRLADKVALLREHDIVPCLGGTLLEIAFAQDAVEDCLAWALRSGITAVEVSRGTVPMSVESKQSLIRRASREFTVLAETGFKDSDRALTAGEWSSEIAGDLAAGASFAVAEGRESGTVGLYDGCGRPLVEVVEAVVAAAGQDRAIFEAPTKAQQVWFINRFGPEVNLGNVAATDVLGLATLRRGLRSDTLGLSVLEFMATGT